MKSAHRSRKVMSQLNGSVYQSLLAQIEVLLTENFIRKLECGKYCRWGTDLTPSDIIPMLSAIGCYGMFGLPCPDIDTKPLLFGQKADQQSDEPLWLSQEQQNALSFLAQFYADSNRSEMAIPLDYTQESSYFPESVNWAMDLTESDLLGIIWHIGGFGCRAWSNLEDGYDQSTINDYHPRAQECLIALMRVARNQPTYYQVAGVQYPLREHHRNPQEA